MVDNTGQEGAARADDAAPSPPHEESTPEQDAGLVEDLGALIDNGRTYAQAELAFQKTRAALAGRFIGIALGAVVVALILLNIAFLALAVGLVIALEAIVGIWGAIAIVVGALLLLVLALGFLALHNGKKLARIFGSPKEGDGA